MVGGAGTAEVGIVGDEQGIERDIPVRGPCTD